MLCLFQYRVRPVSNAGEPQKAQKSQNRSFCVFVPFVAIPGKRLAAEFSKRLNSSISLLVFIRVHSWFVVFLYFFLRGPSWITLFPSGLLVLQFAGARILKFLVTKLPWLISPFR